MDCPLFCLYLYVFRNIIYINLGRPQYPLVPIAATACAIWTSVESIASVHFIPEAFSRRNGRSGLRLRGLTNFPLVTRARRAFSRRNGRNGFRLGGLLCHKPLALDRRRSSCHYRSFCVLLPSVLKQVFLRFSVLLWLFPYPAYSVRSRTFIVSYAPMLSELHHG